MRRMSSSRSSTISTRSVSGTALKSAADSKDWYGQLVWGELRMWQSARRWEVCHEFRDNLWDFDLVEVAVADDAIGIDELEAGPALVIPGG